MYFSSISKRFIFISLFCVQTWYGQRHVPEGTCNGRKAHSSHHSASESSRYPAPNHVSGSDCCFWRKRFSRACSSTRSIWKESNSGSGTYSLNAHQSSLAGISFCSWSKVGSGTWKKVGSESNYSSARFKTPKNGVSGQNGTKEILSKGKRETGCGHFYRSPSRWSGGDCLVETLHGKLSNSRRRD